MAPTPSAKSNQTHFGNPKTPQSKHRLNFNLARPSPNPAAKEAPPAEHPVEVVGRIRDYPDRKEKPPAALKLNADRQSLRVKTDIGYRDFHLDGVSFSEEEDLDLFYKKFVGARINGVKLGDKCTIMMYGPTGAGKSHTMFGSSKQPGIVYRSLKEILGEGDEVSENCGVGTFVQVTVLEIYNEEIYDLLSTNTGGGFGFGWSKGNASKVRLEIMGKRAKNATFISGNDAGSLSKEIQKVEKRRIVKSTLSNDRSSRSHCMIILDVPTVGGRLMLVDMAGSENIEQAGQSGFEAKMQTAKINQGNIALKRVVESIANGDSHVPFRDSKLTMLLQDSFEDDKSKILMILCASPDPKELFKTISTLEYGAKAKCIVRGPSTPIKDKGGDDSSSADVLGSRIAAMDQFIYKLQVENKLREKEKNEAQKELRRKEEEISALRAKLSAAEGKGLKSNEEEVKIKVKEQTLAMKSELEKKIQECQQMANKFVEMERRKMEERMLQQQQEVDLLRRRLEEIELDLRRSKGSADLGGETSFAERILEIYSDDSDMVKSMDLSKSYDMETIKRDAAAGAYRTENSSSIDTIFGYNSITNPSGGEEDVVTDVTTFTTNKVSLSTVFEEEEEEEDGEDNNKCSTDEEVQKEVVEEKTICSSPVVGMPDMLSQSGSERERRNEGEEEEEEEGFPSRSELSVPYFRPKMDRYQRVEKPRVETAIDENEIRITSQGRMRNYISYAMSVLQEKEPDKIVFKAMGRAINKTVTIVELIKRRVVGLHQITSITSTDITDTWEPLEEGLLPLETTRHVSMITITLSKNELDTKDVGYQLPIPTDQVKVSTEIDYEERSPTGRGRGRQGGRGRGRPRVVSGNGYLDAEYDDGGYDRNRSYGRRGRGRGGNFRGRGRGRGGYNGPQFEMQQDGGYGHEEPVAQGRGRSRNFRGRGRGGYNDPQFDTQQDGGYDYWEPAHARGRGRNFHGRGRGGYNDPQFDMQQDGGYDYDEPAQGRGRGRNFRGRGRGGYNGPNLDTRQDGGYEYEAQGQGGGHNFHGRGRGGYNGPQFDTQQDGGYNYEAAAQGRGRGRNFRGHGRGGYNGPQFDTQRDGGYNYEAPAQGQGRARGRGDRGRGRGGFRSNGPIHATARYA